jgi:UDP-N-acetylglucosamine--N-acetylmuramyl-(pentapeptide) pyrophosphoryl-undecaprenol N-acetylglucosamine transferase
MGKARPDVVLAMGSYASIGPVLAARTLGVPVVLHEANATPGRAVILLARHADVLALAYESARPFFRGCFVEVTGLPVRPELATRPPLAELDADVFTVLVMGGSQGAHALNETAREGLAQLWSRGREFQVVHLSGPADEDAVRGSYEQAGIPHLVSSFLDDIGRAYRSADLAISRAGASACAELTLCGVPSLLVPLPWATRDHQSANARAMQASGGAEVMTQEELKPGNLAQYIENLMDDPKRLENMRRALLPAVTTSAAHKLAELAERTGGNHADI